LDVRGGGKKGGWRRLHSVELHNLYASPNAITVISELGGPVACMGEMRNTYSILIVKAEWRRPLGRPRHRWQDNIKMDLRGIFWEPLPTKFQDYAYMGQQSHSILINTPTRFLRF